EVPQRLVGAGRPRPVACRRVGLGLPLRRARPRLDDPHDADLAQGGADLDRRHDRGRPTRRRDGDVRNRSADFDAAVSRAHQTAATVDVLYNRVPVATGLRVTAGSVTLDRTAAQMGRCSVTLAEPLQIPTPTGGILTPYGYELAISRGVK